LSAPTESSPAAVLASTESRASVTAHLTTSPAIASNPGTAHFATAPAIASNPEVDNLRRQNQVLRSMDDLRKGKIATLEKRVAELEAAAEAHPPAAPGICPAGRNHMQTASIRDEVSSEKYFI
jgi:hypothetical protein